MNTNTYALLIGIDCYLTQATATTRSLNLEGCVSDINRVEDFLLHEVGIPEAHILKLTSTNTATGTPLEPVDKWPTRANIINGFNWLGNIGKTGDQVFIYYSGHGARVKTPEKYRSVKPGDGYDEALVPSDYNFDSDRFLRDFELAHILRTYRERGLEVTVVLDSCHSGGATRAEPGLPKTHSEPRARTIGTVSQTFPEPDIPIASDDELQTTIKKLSRRTRDFDGENGWLLEPQGYLLLAACRPSEFAYEHAFDGDEVRGVMTYWLLDSFRTLGTHASFQALYNRVLAHVHEQFPNQTPQLQGERDRLAFKSGRVKTTPTVLVFGVNGKEITLGIGQAQGVAEGQRFAIFRGGERDFSPAQRTALVSVTTIGATTSQAAIVERFTPEPIQKGDQAMPAKSDVAITKRTIRLIHDTATSPKTSKTFNAVEEILTTDPDSYIAVAATDKAADLTVEVNASDEFIINVSLDDETQAMPSGLSSADQNAALRLIERLLHIAKYLNVYELNNYDTASPLRAKVSVEVLGVQSNYQPGNKPAPEPLPNGQSLEFHPGQWTFLKIKNDSAQILNITVLDLRPNWSIRQIHPLGAASYEPLDPGHSFTLPMRASLPDSHDEASDLIKIIATSGNSNFRVLELPALTERETQVVRRGEPLSQETWQQAFGGRIAMRDFETERTASFEWTTTQVKLRTVRGK